MNGLTRTATFTFSAIMNVLNCFYINLDCFLFGSVTLDFSNAHAWTLTLRMCTKTSESIYKAFFFSQTTFLHCNTAKMQLSSSVILLALSFIGISLAHPIFEQIDVSVVSGIIVAITCLLQAGASF